MTMKNSEVLKVELDKIKEALDFMIDRFEYCPFCKQEVNGIDCSRHDDENCIYN